MTEACTFCHLVLAPFAQDREVYGKHVFHKTCLVKHLKKVHLEKDDGPMEQSMRFLWHTLPTR